MSNIFRLTLAALLAVSLPAAAAEGDTDGKVCFLGRCLGDSFSKWHKTYDKKTGIYEKCISADKYGVRRCSDNSFYSGLPAGVFVIGDLSVRHLYFQFTDDKLSGASIYVQGSGAPVLTEMLIGRYGPPSRGAGAASVWGFPGAEASLEELPREGMAAFHLKDVAAEALVSERRSKALRADGRRLF